MRELFLQFRDFAQWKYNVAGEMAIYGELLVQEQVRVKESKSKTEVVKRLDCLKVDK